MKRTIQVTIFFAAFSASFAALCQSYNLAQLLENDQLVAEGRKVTPAADGKGISFDAREDDGVAWLKDVSFGEGTIELDIRGKDLQGQSFVGVAFHGIDKETTDVVYFRPFNFKASEQIRRSRAVQYVSHPQHTWNVLRESSPGKYEGKIDPAPDPNGWFHARIVVEGDQISVYVNDESTPCLQVTKLNDRKTGKIGLWAGYASSGDFANLRLSKK